jgi:multidrug efflux pump subunit AcrA (membrane-fusion protein)
LIVCARIALLLAVTGCSSHGSAKPAATPAPHVDTVTATQGTLSPSLQIAGVITPYRQVGVAADLNEPISEGDVQEGDRVRAGQVLARLLTDDLDAQLASAQRVVSEDAARYNQTNYQVNAVNAQDQSAVRSAQATLREAEVNLSGAIVDLKRYQSLESQGYLAPQTVDEQRTTVASDQSAVTSARASLNQAIANAQANGSGGDAGEQQQELIAARAAADAAQASVEQLKREIARAVIVAPVDGIVDAVNANPGEYPSGRELFTIEQNADVYAVLPTSTSQVVQIQNGANATVVPNGTTRRDPGRVVAVLDEVQPGTTNFTVKALVHNADDHLRAGMPVTATVALPTVSGIKIPVTAFVDDTHASVFVIDNGVVKTQNVTDVKDDGTNAIVSGLAAGTTIVKNVDEATVASGATLR